MKLDYFSLIHKYIHPDSKTYRFYLPHVTMVTHKALEIANRLGLSDHRRRFIEEAAMLHDIGIIKVKAEDIGCTGELPYICHGTEGRYLLEKEGLDDHALISERHTGVGITKEEIIQNDLPLPPRDMVAVSLEEKIISYADIYFSKHPDRLWNTYTQGDVKKWFDRFGPAGEEKYQIFLEWKEEFGE